MEDMPLKQHLIEIQEEDDTTVADSNERQEKDKTENPIQEAPLLSFQRFSSDNCFEGIIERKKLKLEHHLLHFQKKFQSMQDDKEPKYWNEKIILRNTVRDYFCLVQRGEHFYQKLVEKILGLRNQLMEWEDEYTSIPQGKSTKNEEDVVPKIVPSRRELENAEKLYLISRWRSCFHSKSSTDVDYTSSTRSDECLLKTLLSWKRDLMRLEGEYVGLMGVEGKFLFCKKSQGYDADELQRTVRSRRELLLLEEYITERALPSLQKVVEIMLSTRIFSMLKVRRVEPDFNIDNKINLLEKMVPLRRRFLNLEDEYLSLLQERYTKNYNDTSTSFEIDQIHSEHAWKFTLEMILGWRHDLRSLEDKNVCDGKRYLRMRGNCSFVSKEKLHDIVDSNEKLKKLEEEYCQLMRRRYLTIIHNDIPSIDVARDVNQEALLKDHMLSSREKMNKLEIQFNSTLGGNLERFQLQRRGLCRSYFEQIEDKYFDELKLRHNASLKKREASEGHHERMEPSDSEINIPPEEERPTTLQQNNRVRTWEIRRLIVVGGLIESVTSLVIVTSICSKCRYFRWKYSNFSIGKFDYWTLYC